MNLKRFDFDGQYKNIGMYNVAYDNSLAQCMRYNITLTTIFTIISEITLWERNENWDCSLLFRDYFFLFIIFVGLSYLI